MRTSISKQLGLPVAPPLPKAPSLEVQLGFVAEYDKSLNNGNLNFVAEYDKSLNTKNNGGYFNATGEEKNFKEYYKGSDAQIRGILVGEKISTSEDLDFLEGKKKFYQEGQATLRRDINAIKINQAQKAFGTQAYTQRGKYVSQLWSVDKTIEGIDKRIEEVKVILEKRAAKVKADADAAAAKLKAEAEAAKQAKIAALKKQISESTDPNVKKQLTDQLTGLLEEGGEAIKSNKFILIGGAVAVIGILYYFFRSKQ
jgi:hypothetical protein